MTQFLCPLRKKFPRVFALATQGKDYVAPKVEEISKKVSEEVTPRVEEISRKVSEEFIPKVNDAAQVVREQFADVAAESTVKLQKMGVIAAPKPKKSRKGLVALLVAATIAVVGVVLWRRAQPVEDPWAEEYWEDIESAEPEKDLKETLMEKANEVKEAASEKAEEAAKVAKETATKVADKAKEVKDKVIN